MDYFFSSKGLTETHFLELSQTHSWFFKYGRSRTFQRLPGSLRVRPYSIQHIKILNTTCWLYAQIQHVALCEARWRTPFPPLPPIENTKQTKPRSSQLNDPRVTCQAILVSTQSMLAMGPQITSKDEQFWPWLSSENRLHPDTTLFSNITSSLFRGGYAILEVIF